MTGKEIYDVLKGVEAASGKKVHLHHANSVLTSCSFLQAGGLLSRAFVENNKLQQTPQESSDDVDKKYNIWDRVFVDHVDIHDRGGRVMGPNLYGPVLFILDVEALLNLPQGTDILISKLNPVHWPNQTKTDAERYFLDLNELKQNLQFGTFHKMLIMNVPGGRFEFPAHKANVILDDPQRKLSSGENAYDKAAERLNIAAKAGKVDLTITKRTCKPECSCLTKWYGNNYRWPLTRLDLNFS